MAKNFSENAVYLHSSYVHWVLNRGINMFAVAIRTGTVRRVWFAIRTAVGIFLAIVVEIFVFFDFYNLTFVKQQ